jgi:hypothetical protein
MLLTSPVSLLLLTLAAARALSDCENNKMMLVIAGNYDKDVAQNGSRTDAAIITWDFGILQERFQDSHTN